LLIKYIYLKLRLTRQFGGLLFNYTSICLDRRDSSLNHRRRPVGVGVGGGVGGGGGGGGGGGDGVDRRFSP
jgi:hypothetical protein